MKQEKLDPVFFLFHFGDRMLCNDNQESHA